MKIQFVGNPKWAMPQLKRGPTEEPRSTAVAKDATDRVPLWPAWLEIKVHKVVPQAKKIRTKMINMTGFRSIASMNRDAAPIKNKNVMDLSLPVLSAMDPKIGFPIPSKKKRNPRMTPVSVTTPME